MDQPEERGRPPGRRLAGPQDYARGWAAVRGYVKAVKADIYPLSLTGDVCFWCQFREGICGGVAVPDEDYGRPAPKPVKA
jgi:hypothetical protein